MIPTKPPPTFKEAERWSNDFRDFVSRCLVKNPEERATATQLLQVSVLFINETVAVTNVIIYEPIGIGIIIREGNLHVPVKKF